MQKDRIKIFKVSQGDQRKNDFLNVLASCEFTFELLQLSQKLDFSHKYKDLKKSAS